MILPTDKLLIDVHHCNKEINHEEMTDDVSNIVLLIMLFKKLNHKFNRWNYCNLMCPKCLEIVSRRNYVLNFLNMNYDPHRLENLTLQKR